MRKAFIASIAAVAAIGLGLAFLGGMTASGGPAEGISADQAPHIPGGFGPGLQHGGRWASLSPEEQAALRERLRKFAELPPEERERMKARYEQFMKLSPEQRLALRERWHQFSVLSPEQREPMLKQHDRWQGLPPERRKMIEERLQKVFQQMSDRDLLDFMHKLNIWRILPDDQKEQVFKRFFEIRRQTHPLRDRRRGHGPDEDAPLPPPQQ